MLGPLRYLLVPVQIGNDRGDSCLLVPPEVWRIVDTLPEVVASKVPEGPRIGSVINSLSRNRRPLIRN